jgi:5'-nucleotidase
MPDGKPLILVTNDDGIHAPGLRSLVEVAKEFGKVLVVAPDKPQSGMGHAVTINGILRLDKVEYSVDGVEAYSTSGTPVDCVKLAIYRVLGGKKPDFLVSGVNHGSNSSINVIYSGTMSAAVEGAVEGIPSIGFSLLDHDENADFKPAQTYIRKMLKSSLTLGIPKDTCLNVNIPKLSLKKINGIRVCRQARAFWEDSFEPKTDPSGKEYYWLTGKFNNEDRGEDTDEWALENGFVSVVPVQYDLTAHHAIATLNTWNL